MRVAVVDYGLCNMFSVLAAIRECGHDPVLDIDGEQIPRAEVAVVPGVAAFGAGMTRLVATGQAAALLRRADAGDGMVGLCLGAQMFLDSSQEAPDTPGLGVARGRVVALDPTLGTVPNQGWTLVRSAGDTPSGFLSDGDPEYYYFSHSFKCLVSPDSTEIATARSGAESILAAYRQENVVGVQFHPERSGAAGLAFLGRLLAAARV